MFAREAHVYGFMHPPPADARAIVQFCCRTNCNSLPEELQFVAQRIEKRRATNFQLTGNVFSKRGSVLGNDGITDGCSRSKQKLCIGNEGHWGRETFGYGQQKTPEAHASEASCGAYGTRTRDPMRDRHVF